MVKGAATTASLVFSRPEYKVKTHSVRGGLIDLLS